MNTIFLSRIRKLAVKQIVFLAIFGLVALAYIASPLIALAVSPNANNNNHQQNAQRRGIKSVDDSNNSNNSSDSNNNNNCNCEEDDDDHNNCKCCKNEDDHNNCNNNNNGNNNNQGNTDRRSSQIDAGIFVINGQSIQQRSIAFLQIVDNTQKPLTPSQYQNLLTFAARPDTPPLPVRVEFVFQKNTQRQSILTTGQFVITQNQPTGSIIVTTDNQQKLIVDPSTPIPLHVPNASKSNY